jgi:hypothetical protein
MARQVSRNSLEKEQSTISFPGGSEEKVGGSTIRRIIALISSPTQL